MPLSPFREALRKWSDADDRAQAFSDQLIMRKAAWLADNPVPTELVAINCAEREAARITRTDEGTYRVPFLRLSSDPADLANPDFPRFDAYRARKEWVQKNYGAIIVDGEHFPRRLVWHGELCPDPEFITALFDHERQREAFFEDSERQQTALWSEAYSAFMALIRTPAQDLDELATRIELYALETVTGPFRGFVSVRESIRRDVMRLMGGLQDTDALKRLREHSAQDEAADVQDDLKDETQMTRSMAA